jgi:acyl carrier protein phosphodiesterase
MNFLAHLYLSCGQEELMVGNFLGDFITNHQLAKFPAPIQEGVILHRKIDSYTDDHPIVREGVGRLRPHYRKYAPVVIDVYYDYLLANNWDRFHERSLPEFTQSIYRILEKYIDIMPAFLQTRLPLMIQDDWLVRYGEREGLTFTFERMQKRVSFPEHLQSPLAGLDAHYKTFHEEFRGFFPEVIRYVEQECIC